MTALYTIRDALSAFFSSPLRKWSSVFLLAILALGGAYYYQLQSLGKVQAAYTISNSARFISGNSDNLTKTLTTPTSQNIYTFSAWVKRGKLGVLQNIFGVSTNYSFGFPAADTLAVTIAGTAQATTVGVWRDPAVWMHVVYVQNGTAITVYVNGASVATGTGTNSQFNTAAAHQIGSSNSTNFYDGYLSDTYFIDGSALSPTCFGSTDANGYWRPKTYSTASPCAAYGTNGFHLAFGNGNALGTDSAGSNNWATSTNMTAAVSQLTDSPTNSFATLNPLDLSGSTGTYSNGNLQYTSNNGNGTYAQAYSNFWITSGKWYAEWTAGADLVNAEAGFITGTTNPGTNRYPGQDTYTYAYIDDGRKVNNASYTAYGNSWTTGDVVSIAIDADAGSVTFYKNGVSQGVAFSSLTGPYRFLQSAEVGGIGQYNFGQGGQSGLTYDSASGGTFKYTPPSGFKALSTNNLTAPTIAQPNNYFNAVIYTGTGATLSVLNSSTTPVTYTGFTPDLVWIKDRTSATSSLIFDSSLTATNYWSSNSSNAVQTAANSLTAFLTNGFSLGAASTAGYNLSGNNYISWMWKKSATAGVDIQTYTGDNTANRNIDHQLGAAPEMVIVKRRDAAGDPYVWHNKLTGAAYFLKLDTTAAQSNTTPPWGTGGWTSSTFMVSNGTENINASGATYVAYLFKGIDGFSKFGSYTGNAAADGPFIYTGFKPRYVMIKSSTAVDAWLIYDTARDTYNVSGTTLVPNTAAADATISGIDFLSNGFKLRTITTTPNAAQTYIYAAFADVPFYYSAQAAASAVITSAVTFLMGMTF